jgi:hypothetical protein
MWYKVFAAPSYVRCGGAELRAILEHEFDELRMEAERTESGDFRAKVQKRERLVRRLIDQLKP